MIEKVAHTRLYTSIHKITLGLFQDVYVDGDISALVISGEPTEEELEAAYFSIIEQYNTEMAKEEGGMQNNLRLEVIRLTYKMQNSRRMLEVFKEGIYIKEFAEAINSMLNSNFKFDKDNDESFRKDVNGAWSCTKELEMKLSIKREALEEMMKKEADTDQKASRKYFDKILLSLSDWRQREINESISVSKFCLLVQQYNQYIDRQKLK